MIVLIMLFLLMSSLYKLKHTGNSAVERKEKHLNPNLGLFVFFCNYMHICIHYFIYFFRPKHPLKVHVWARISLRGATGICTFDGIMDAPFYMNILKKTLFPFVKDVFPNGLRLMADNDSKHTSNVAKQLLEDNEIYWWRTPPESPDLNPIEKLYHELKVFMRR